MDEILKYVQGDGSPNAWYETTDEGQLVITNGQQSIPVVGTLSANTTPADFERFARLAALYYARRKTGEARRGKTPV